MREKYGGRARKRNANVSSMEHTTDLKNTARQDRTKRTSPQPSPLDDLSINASAALCTANGEFLVGASEFYYASGLRCAPTWLYCWHFDVRHILSQQPHCVPLAMPVLFLDSRGHWQSPWHTHCAECGSNRMRVASICRSISRRENNGFTVSGAEDTEPQRGGD